MIRPTLAMLAGLLITAPLDDSPTYEPTDGYDVRQVEGWTVLVNKKFLADQPELADRALTLLRFQLYQVARRLPEQAVESLRGIKIWLEGDEPHHPCAAYHPDAGWLKAHAMNPDKARCVEIANARKFLEWTFDQPWMVLHELAHGYHHQVLDKGFRNPEIKAAFDQAMEAKSYGSVLRLSGKVEKAYAATNPIEYIAEATEAFFGTNDFYPFVKAELKEHDPALFDLLGKLWGGTDGNGRR
jgi:hypothetical protein